MFVLLSPLYLFEESFFTYNWNKAFYILWEVSSLYCLLSTVSLEKKCLYNTNKQVLTFSWKEKERQNGNIIEVEVELIFFLTLMV